MGIGEQIKLWRKLNQFSQYDLSIKLGVSDKTVSSWETNRTEPQMGMIEQICRVLNCKKTDIIGEDDFDANSEYYLNATTKKVAQEIYENKNLALLFDAAKDASPEDLQTIHTMLLALKAKEHNNE